MRAFAVALAVLALAPSAWSAAGPVVQLDFSNPGLSPSHWVLTIYPDGNGHFRSESDSQPADARTGIEALTVDREIRMTPQFAQRVFQTAQRHNMFNGQCDSHLKVAFQGWKKLSYSGPEGDGTCAFNYSKDKEIQELSDTLVSVANTVTEGARLESLLHHDPLGLDKEMEYLVEAATDGRAQQLCTIRGVLEHLAEDENVLDRVRKRARLLLAKAEN
jgi:uncharacterized coiled-coil protein SlyX